MKACLPLHHLLLDPRSAIGKSSNKLIGMTAVMDYVISCKNAPVQYHRSVKITTTRGTRP